MSMFYGPNAKAWLFAMRRYFLFYNILENQKIIIASFNMNGLAQEWFEYMEANDLLSLIGPLLLMIYYKGLM